MQDTSLYAATLKAQQKRVDRGILRPLQRDWQACLSFAYHTQEEAWEVVRELPRREWKDQTVSPERVLSELADTQIQLYTTLAYAGFTESDLASALLSKLQVKREDWK
jgi:chromosome condensin MukBEF complex kleisin-like MukF subunit